MGFMGIYGDLWRFITRYSGIWWRAVCISVKAARVWPGGRGRLAWTGKVGQAGRGRYSQAKRPDRVVGQAELAWTGKGGQAGRWRYSQAKRPDRVVGQAELAWTGKVGQAGRWRDSQAKKPDHVVGQAELAKGRATIVLVQRGRSLGLGRNLGANGAWQ
jgi:uncharacterized protein YndB with AHSA1/START domain